MVLIMSLDTLKKYGKIFLNAILAGCFIGIAGTVFLSVQNPVIGAFLFAFGLMTILCFSFKLYTGAIGYLAVQGKNTPRYLVALVLIWCGNLVGTYLVGTLVRASRIYAGIESRVASICDVKLHDAPAGILILSVFCGLLMYVAVESFRRKELGDIFRFASVFLCVAIFILSGFEHCIANMYYFSVAAKWDCHTLNYVLLMTLGNSIGGMLIPCADYFRNESHSSR